MPRRQVAEDQVANSVLGLPGFGGLSPKIGSGLSALRVKAMQVPKEISGE